MRNRKITTISASTILLLLSSCSSVLECSDSSYTPAKINQDSIKIKYIQSYYIKQDSVNSTFSNDIGINFYSLNPLNMNLLPSFSGNNLSVRINDQEVKYYPLNNAAGGIHGDCPEWSYPDMIFYNAHSLDTTLKIEIVKNGSSVMQWTNLFTIDTSKILKISDTILFDTVLVIKINFRDKNNKYVGDFENYSSFSAPINIPDTVPDSMKISLNLRNIQSNNRSYTAQSAGLFDYAIRIYTKNPLTPLSDTMTTSGYQLYKSLSNTSIAQIIKYQKLNNIK